MTVTKKQTATAIALALGAALTLTSTAAMAFGGKDGRGIQGRHGGFMQMEFADIDMDGSGLITAEDLKAHGEARFSAADANGDGELSVEEMQAHRAAMKAERKANADTQQKGKGKMDEKRMGWMIEKMISKRDTNGNGTLSLDEMSPEQARLDRMIDRFDTDDDNAISQAEFEEAQKEAFMRGRNGKNGHGHGKRQGG